MIVHPSLLISCAYCGNNEDPNMICRTCFDSITHYCAKVTVPETKNRFDYCCSESYYGTPCTCSLSDWN